MSKQSLDRVLAGIRAQPYTRRSDLYRWLREHHKELAPRIAAEAASWTVVASEIAAIGVCNRKGQPPSGKSVRLCWLRVCRDVEKAAAEPKAVRQKYPAQLSPAWRPEPIPQSGIARPGPQPVVPPPPIRRPASVTAPQTGLAPALRDEDLPPEAQEMLRELDEDLAEQDRKKFGRWG
jgi:hypothetical protein